MALSKINNNEWHSVMWHYLHWKNQTDCHPDFSSVYVSSTSLIYSWQASLLKNPVLMCVCHIKSVCYDHKTFKPVFVLTLEYNIKIKWQTKLKYMIIVHFRLLQLFSGMLKWNLGLLEHPLKWVQTRSAVWVKCGYSTWDTNRSLCRKQVVVLWPCFILYI